MSSNINPNNIDGTYPVAGQDNDSQGFRTNFTNIKNNFIYSKAEIEDLQAKAILKAGLTGTVIDNNMSGTLFRSAEIKDLRESRVSLGTANGTLTLDHSAAHYYTVQANGPLSLEFIGFPDSGRVGRIKLEVTINDVADTLTFPSSVTYGVRGLQGFDGTDTVTFAAPGTYLFEFVSDSAGQYMHVADFSRCRTDTAVIINVPVTAIGQAGDVKGMIKYDYANRYMYICIADYDGTNVIWHKSGIFTALT